MVCLFLVSVRVSFQKEKNFCLKKNRCGSRPHFSAVFLTFLFCIVKNTEKVDIKKHRYFLLRFTRQNI